MLSNHIKIDNVEMNPNSPTTEMEKRVVDGIHEGFGQLILSLQCPAHNEAVAVSVTNMGEGKLHYLPLWCCDEFRATAEEKWSEQNTAS